MPPRSGILRRIEAMSITGTERHWARIPADLARRVRPQVLPVGDGLATLMPRSDSLRMNRVIGLGHRGKASEATIDTIIARYQAARVKRFSVLLGPGPQSAEIERWLLRRRFTRRTGHLLLLRDCRKPVPRAETDLRIARAGRTHREAVVRIVSESFSMPASRRKWALATAADPAYQRVLAFSGKMPVAVAALRVEGSLAWLGGAATRTCWRHHGAHGALIAARLKRAALAGCRWAWCETAEPAPGRPDGSRRNLVRFGFEPVCLKPSYLWTSG
jgi:hypothetical protein